MDTKDWKVGQVWISSVSGCVYEMVAEGELLVVGKTSSDPQFNAEIGTVMYPGFWRKAVLSDFTLLSDVPLAGMSAGGGVGGDIAGGTSKHGGKLCR